MQKWEYCRVDDRSRENEKGIFVVYPDGTRQLIVDLKNVKPMNVGNIKFYDPEGINFLKALNNLGDAGWEIINMGTGGIWLKRPKPL